MATTCEPARETPRDAPPDTTTAAAVTSSTTPATAATGHRWTPQLRGILTILCTVLFLDGLDASLIGVALPAIGAELAMPATTLQWMVNGYLLGYGGLLLLAGRAADLFNRRTIFLTALGVFAAASLVGGLVNDPATLIATRFIKGGAAAFTAATALAILTTTFRQGPSRNRALSIFGAFGASGFSCGLIIGGALTTLGWRWTLLVPVPVAVAALVAGTIMLRRNTPAARGGYDMTGAAMMTTAMLLTVYTIVTAPQRDWPDPLTISSVALIVALLGGFVVSARRTAHPLIRWGILRNANIMQANLGMAVLFGTFVSFQFLMTLYLQNSLRWSPLMMALALLPGGLIVTIGSPFTGRLINRHGPPRLIAASMASLSLGYGWLLATAGTQTQYATTVLPSMLLIGAGFTLGYSSITAHATNGIHDNEQGMAAGLLQTSGQLGPALVLAVVTAVTTTDIPSDTGAGFDQFRPGHAIITAIAVAGLLLSAAGIPGSAARRSVRWGRWSALQHAKRTPARTAAAAPEILKKIQAWLSIRRQAVRRR